MVSPVRCSGSIGVDYHQLSTADPYHVALEAYLDSRTRQKARHSARKFH
jgi:hypothetical protein